MGKRKSKRLQTLLARGGVPFNCRNCDRVFACERDRAHHEKDAHTLPQHPNAKEQKAAKMAHRHHNRTPQNFDNKAPVITPAATDPPAKGFLGLFKKEKEELFVIDFVTPHTGLRCTHKGCEAAEIIPLTGRCIAHDALCRTIMMARVIKAEADAKKAQEAADKANGVGFTSIGESRRNNLDVDPQHVRHRALVDFQRHSPGPELPVGAEDLGDHTRLPEDWHERMMH